MTTETLSSLAMVTSAVLYLVAMMAHAAEWAFARQVAPDVERAADPVAVGAAGSVSTLPQPPATASPAPSLRVDQAGRVGVAITLVAFATHLLGVISRGVAGQRPPWGNMYEFVTAAMAFVVLLYLALLFRYGMRWLGLPVTLLATMGQGLAVTVFYVKVAPLVPALHSVWFVIHIVAACISAAAFNIGGLAAILYLVRSRAEAKGRVSGYLARLPDAVAIDRISYRAIAFALPIWTFTIAAGAVWAEYAWGRYWGWDPKETWSLVTWVVFAAYLHARATAGWRGTKAAGVAILGLGLFWFNFIGVNLLVSGLHSYAGI